jgi:hypothetical protein
MYVHTPTQSLILKVKDPFAVRELIPHSKTLDNFTDGHNLAVKWTLDSARLLRNIGIAAPSPIVSFYDWPGRYKPLPQQIEMASFTTLNPRGFNLSEQGTGKTYATLWAIDYLMNVGEVKRALVMCPLSSTTLTWAQDCFSILPHRVCSVIHGTAKRRMENLTRPIDIYILNHDGIVIEDVAREIRRRKDINMIVVDEASFYRNAGIDKHRFLTWCSENKLRVILMTGTPCPNAPTDAWALAQLVNPALAPMSFSAFQRETMYQSGTRWVPRLGSEAEAFKIMQPAIRFMKKDCLELPPVMGPRAIKTSLSAEQEDAFELMKEEMILFAKDNQINAVNGADKINKMRQIMCGAVKDPDTEEYHLLDCTPRIRDLRTLISQASAKVLVIAPFKGILRVLAEALPKPDKVTGLPGYSCETLNGDDTAKQRVDKVTRFKTQPDPRVLICHPRVMSHGLNLTEADTTIFYAPIYSNDEYLQVIERFNRLGQKHTMHLLRMVAGAFEAAIYRKVDERGTLQNNILDLYQSVINRKDDHL